MPQVLLLLLHLVTGVIAVQLNYGVEALDNHYLKLHGFLGAAK
jgi:hypothetical protein